MSTLVEEKKRKPDLDLSNENKKRTTAEDELNQDTAPLASDTPRDSVIEALVVLSRNMQKPR